MDLVEEVDGSTVTVRLNGELDMATATAFEQAVTARMTAPEIATVVISFGGLTFTDSAGLTSLVAIQERAEREGVALVLTDVSRHVRKLMEITSLLGTFDVR